MTSGRALLAVVGLVALLGCQPKPFECDSEPGEERRLALSAEGETDTHGLTATVTAQLLEAPDASVTVHLLATPPEQFSVTPEEVTFTPEDFAAPRTVVVAYRAGSGVAPTGVIVSVDRVTSEDRRLDCFQPYVTVPHRPAGCGDRVVEPGEDCDFAPGPAFTLDCAYGETSCERCGTQTGCRNVPGRPIGRCGDGVVTAPLERCEPSPDASIACGELTPGALGTTTCDPFACNWDLGACSPPGTLPCRDLATCEGCAGTEVRHACLLDRDGGVRCLGQNLAGEADAPPGPFVAVADGARFSCGLRPDGGVECWGAVADGGTRTGPFIALAAGARHACGLRADGEAECWGESDAGALAAPPGLGAVALSAGRLHTCARLADAGVRCWGDDRFGQSSPGARPPSLDVAAGPSRSCALLVDGGLSCWGGGLACREPPRAYAALVGGPAGLGGVRPDGQFDAFTGTLVTPVEPAGRWSFLSGGPRESGCGVRPDGAMECFGFDFRYFEPRRGPFTKAWGNPPFACGLKPDAGLDCFAAPSWVASTPPDLGTVTDLSWSGQPLVGCSLAGTVANCWGLDTPSRLFTQLEVRRNAACGVENDYVYCWGTPRLDPPRLPFKSVALARDGSAACGVRKDGTLSCWGRTTADLGDRAVSLAPPSGRHLAVALGQYVACAIREATIGDTAGEVTCWGDPATGIGRVPAGRFKAVFFLGDRACGQRVDDTVSCWGGQAPHDDAHPPVGPSDAVVLGSGVACARAADGGDWGCFGDDGFGLATPARTPFVHLATSDAQLCAVRADGGVRCWRRLGDAMTLGQLGAATRVGLGDGAWVCTLLGDAGLECRGAPVAAPPLLGLSVGGAGACGVTGDGGVACVGQPPAAWVPAGAAARAVRLDGAHVCAWLSPSDEVRCAGSPALGATAPGLRDFDVAAGRLCLVDAQGGVTCSGAPFDGGLPLGDFDALALGTSHGCARATDGGGLDCFGSAGLAVGALPAPAVTFDVADGLTCALDPEGRLSCRGWMVR